MPRKLFRHSAVFGLLLCLLPAACAAAKNQDASVYAFVHVNVVPMDRERLLFDHTVVIEKDRIVAMGPSESTEVPKGAIRIDGRRQMYLMPGLSDMHAHLRYPSDLTLLLANGVTTVRNMSGKPIHIEWREKVKRGEMLGPDIVTAGPILSGPDSGKTVVNTHEEGARQVEAQKAAGYDFIKVYDQLPKAAYEGIIDAAQRLQMPVAGHVPTEIGVEGVLQAHQVSIEHAEQYVYHYFGHDYDVTKIPVIARETNEAGTYVCPTLAYIGDLALLAEDHEKLFARPELPYLHPETLLYWRSQSRDSSIENRLMDDFHNKLIQGFRDAGVPMLSGTDTYIIGSVMGFALHRELKRLAAAGLTNYQVLETTTRHAGEFLHADFGTVRVGNRANLILLRANPLADLENLRSLAGVFHNGVWLPETRLQAMLQQVRLDFAPGQSYIAAYRNKGAAEVVRMRNARASGPFPYQDLVFNGIGNMLLAKKEYAQAVEILKINVRDYPSWWVAYDSLGDAYQGLGNKQMAILNYRRSLNLNRNDQNAIDMLKHLGT